MTHEYRNLRQTCLTNAGKVKRDVFGIVTLYVESDSDKTLFVGMRVELSKEARDFCAKHGIKTGLNAVHDGKHFYESAESFNSADSFFESYDVASDEYERFKTLLSVIGAELNRHGKSVALSSV